VLELVLGVRTFDCETDFGMILFGKAT